MRKESVVLPSVAVFTSGIIWGSFWLPMRELDASGITASWAFFIVFGMAGLGYFTAFFFHRLKTGKTPWDVIVTGLIIGSSIVFYAIGIVLTEVVKAILLLYLAPVWTTIFGRLMLGETITPFRICAVLTGVTGLLVVLGIFEGIPKFSNVGDIFALTGGILYSYATVRIRRQPDVPVWQQVGAFYIGAAIVSVIFIILPIQGLEHPPTLDTVVNSAIWLTILLVIYLPTIYLIMWGSQILSPTRVLLLLMTEVFCGVLSAALLSGEPIGLTQIIGTGLIISAALIDALGSRQSTYSINIPRND